MVYNHTVVCEEFLLYQDKVNKLIKAGIDEIDQELKAESRHEFVSFWNKFDLNHEWQVQKYVEI